LEQELCGPDASASRSRRASDQVAQLVAVRELFEASGGRARLGFRTSASADSVVGQDEQGAVTLIQEFIVPEILGPDRDVGGTALISRVLDCSIEFDQPGTQSFAAVIGCRRVEGIVLEGRFFLGRFGTLAGLFEFVRDQHRAERGRRAGRCSAQFGCRRRMPFVDVVQPEPL